MHVFRLEQHVEVIATGEIGRVEQWHEGSRKYWVEFNRDFATREWFLPEELKALDQPSKGEAGR